MTQSVDQQLRFAIAHKRLIELAYKGSARLVEPHDYGVQNGKAQLLVYQRGAMRSAPGKSVIGWRLFEVLLIERCVVMDETFKGSRGTSDQEHYEWDVLYARVN